MQLLPKNKNVERISFLFEMDLRQALKKIILKQFAKIIYPKGQIILKCPFVVFNFLQKMNENKSTYGLIVVM